MLISIHALHEESDDQGLIGSTTGEISIHALHEESDGDGLDQHERIFGFQSTLSMRRATRRGPGHSGRGRISIHALHEESDRRVGSFEHFIPAISIHALHEESDFNMIFGWVTPMSFQSTLSMRRATVRIETVSLS